MKSIHITVNGGRGLPENTENPILVISRLVVTLVNAKEENLLKKSQGDLASGTAGPRVSCSVLRNHLLSSVILLLASV